MGGEWCHMVMKLLYGGHVELCAPYLSYVCHMGARWHCEGADGTILEPGVGYMEPLASYGTHVGAIRKPKHHMSHAGGVWCEIEAVCAIWELDAVIWEEYSVVWKPDPPDWNRVIQLGAMRCCMEAKCYMRATGTHV
jgi:hypothetical protein